MRAACAGGDVACRQRGVLDVGVEVEENASGDAEECGKA